MSTATAFVALANPQDAYNELKLLRRQVREQLTNSGFVPSAFPFPVLVRVSTAVTSNSFKKNI